MPCPLCNLPKQEIIYQDDICFCIVNIEPLKDGHLMVLPKRHVTALEKLTEKEAQQILKLLGRMSKIISKIYQGDPVIVMNLGKLSTQPHLHFHILPSKGGLRDFISRCEGVPKRRRATNKELKKMAEKIKKEL